MSTEYFQVIGDLMMMLITIFAVLYIMKKIKISRNSENKTVKILNILPVGAKEKIIFLEVNGISLLLGATQNHIETLYVFNESESVSTIAKDAPTEPMLFTEKIAGLIK